MKKSKIAVIAGAIAIVSIALADPIWVEFEKGAEGEAPELTVLESSFAGTTINLKTFGMWVEDVEEAGVTYQRLTLPASHTGEVGKPMLPVVNRLVAIPPTAGVKVIVESKNEIVLEDYLVYPAQPPTMDTEPEEEFQKDDEFYSLDTLYPAELHEVGPPGILRDVRLVRLSIKPFRYNPKKKELTVATELTIRLDYSGIDERNQLKRQREYINQQWERLYRAQILNYEDLYGHGQSRIMEGPPMEPIPPPDYLIICAHDFYDLSPGSPLKEFIDWKNQQGCKVYARDLNLIADGGDPDDVNDVKRYIKQWWQAGGEDPIYVLLVGDAPNPPQCADDSHVPTYFDKDNIEDGYALISDYWYSLLTGPWDDPDPYPEICIGRWCVENDDHLATYVAKTLAYERDVDPGWDCDELLFVVHEQGMWFKEAKEEIRNEILPAGCNPLLQYGEYDTTSNDKVKSKIQDDGGVGIVNYQGHGGARNWIGWTVTPPIHFTTSDIYSLDQSSFHGYPIVYNMACYNGKIIMSLAFESMVEAWTRHEIGGGVGALGASSRISSLAVHVIDTAIFRSHYDYDLDCGMAINAGKSALIDECDVPVTRMSIYSFYWIGDPSLDIWRAQPQEAYAEYNAVCNPPDPYLVVTVYLDDGHQTPVKGSKVCIYKDDEYHAVSYTDSLGAAYLPLPPSGSSVVVTDQVAPICIVPVIDTFYLEGSFSMDVEESVELIDWQLKPVYPNPLRSRAVISYSVAGKPGSNTSQFVELKVFDVTGREVKMLISGDKTPGHYELIWNGKDNRDLQCSSGVYFIRMHSNEFNANRRVILLR